MNCNICHLPAADHEHGLFCCPHCGSHCRIWTGEFWTVRCAEAESEYGECGAGTWAKYKDVATMVEDWNRRASPWIKCSERQPPEGADFWIRPIGNSKMYLPSDPESLELVRLAFAAIGADKYEWMLIPE
jgi:hypothetical protein